MTGVIATILVRRDASAFSTRLQRRIERARRRHGVVQIPGLARRRSGHHGDRHGTGRLLKACTALDLEKAKTPVPIATRGLLWALVVHKRAPDQVKFTLYPEYLGPINCEHERRWSIDLWGAATPGEQDRTRLLGYRAVPSPSSCFNGAITSPSAA